VAVHETTLSLVRRRRAALQRGYGCREVIAKLIELDQYWAELEQLGTVLGAYDLVIAATAVHHGHGLATLNRDEFGRVPGLRLVDFNDFLEN